MIILILLFLFSPLQAQTIIDETAIEEYVVIKGTVTYTVRPVTYDEKVDRAVTIAIGDMCKEWDIANQPKGVNYQIAMPNSVLERLIAENIDRINKAVAGIKVGVSTKTVEVTDIEVVKTTGTPIGSGGFIKPELIGLIAIASAIILFIKFPWNILVLILLLVGVLLYLKLRKPKGKTP